MENLITINGHSPIIHETCFVAPNAIITGEVEAKSNTSFWYNVVVRGDVGPIVIGENVNIQDGSMLHATLGKSKLTIGNNVSIGHQAIVHGCEVHDDVLIGMGAIVLDNAVVQSNSIIAAGAVILENTIVESGFLYAGVPAKKIRAIEPEKIELYIKGTCDHYIDQAKNYLNYYQKK